jgi:hypothetical protein
MYAININNAPYIVPKENVQNFLETSEKQKGVAEKLGSIFGKECFEFKEDENGYMVANIDVQRKD